MLESDGALETWAIPRLPRGCEDVHSETQRTFSKCPPISKDCVAEAERLAGHRLDYLDHEGPLRGDRGHVVRVARGEYAPTLKSDDRWVVTVDDGPLAGELILEKIASEPSKWCLSYRRRGRRRAAGAIC
jgi:hypothetical protein